MSCESGLAPPDGPACGKALRPWDCATCWRFRSTLRIGPWSRPGPAPGIRGQADHHRHAEVENTIGDLKYDVGLNHLPSARFAANGAWLGVQVMLIICPAGQCASGWESNWQPPRPSGSASSSSPGGSPARPAASPCIFPGAGPGNPSSAAPSPYCAPYRSLPDLAIGPRSDRRTTQFTH